MNLPPTAGSGYAIHFEGVVWWADPSSHQMVLHDASGTEMLELDLPAQPLPPGQRVVVEGNGTVTRVANGFRLGVIGPVVDNNGAHAMVEKSGAVFLAAGRQPFRLDWFNGINDYGLQVEYQGPNLPRQRIPAAVLFQQATNDASGVRYSVYDVPGEVLPDFDPLPALQSGTVSNFNLDFLPHREHVGVRFTGALAVPEAGLYTFFTRSDDGSQLFVGPPSMYVRILGADALPPPRVVTLGRALGDDDNFQWAEVTGMVTFASERGNGWELELSSGTGRIHLQTLGSAGRSARQLLGRRLRAVGVCESVLTADGLRMAGALLAGNITNLEFETATTTDQDTNTSPMPMLTTASAIHQLKREDAQKGFPVRIQGVVTCVLPEHQAFTLQDATRGIYIVDASESRPFPPQIGEYLEVAGSTDPSLFAPIVNARNLQSLGAGKLPDPVRPTWDQLLNGSLDAQYVELQGIVTTATTTNVTLLTREGRISLELRLNHDEPAQLARYVDALVRIRGTLFANWDYVTHEVKAGELRLYGAAVTVDQPVPEDLFAQPAKTVADLLRFDPQAGVFQRVKVSGQIVHVRNAEFYLTDGHNALRFLARAPGDWQAGDLVEVVGFPDLSGASLLLREAVARKTGHAPLPAPRALPADQLAQSDYDATLVRLKGVLVGIRQTPRECVLEIQSGVRTFAARCNGAPLGTGAPPTGSQLELTGVYASLGASRVAGQDISTFELLLNSPADIQVLARPPWWTLERLLIIVGALVCGLAITGLWITQLHRQVDQRTRELATQIQERQRVEQQRAMEQERARVAQDLHDELGSGLTEISMLGLRAHSAAATEEKRRLYLEQMSGKAREMVAALDEIVWAMNPRHDSLASLVSYFCLYADRFLGLANIAWRLDGAPVPDDFAVDSRHRHQLFLAFKEGLTNVVRHSGAREVRLGIGLENGQVRLTISDNGRGLPAGLRTEEMDGVANMRTRLEKLGGRFELASEPGRGTTLRFFVPVR
jgi:signal transduction histidine kinase